MIILKESSGFLPLKQTKHNNGNFGVQNTSSENIYCDGLHSKLDHDGNRDNHVEL